jgi:hypothetical protein
MGTYSPAAPIGFLLLLTGFLLSIGLLSSTRWFYAVGTGLACALCVLAKQDFWIPACYVLAVDGVLLVLQHASNGRRLAGLLWGTCGVTLFLGLAMVAESVGWAALPGIATGFGTAAEMSGFGFPSWQRVTVEGIVLGIMGTVAVFLLLADDLVSSRSSQKWLTIFVSLVVLGSVLHTTMSYRLRPVPGGTVFATLDVRQLLRALSDLKSQVQIHFPSLMLPVVLGLLVIHRWRRLSDRRLRNTVALLLGLCVAARVRRGFQHVDWFSFLLEIPAYVCAAELFVPGLQSKGRRATALAMAALIGSGVYSYWNLGVGPLTRRNSFQRLETPRGTVFVSAAVADGFRKIQDTLAQRDPSGERPVFAFGYSGGFNYFLNRKNPTPLTVGFRISPFSPERIVAELGAHTPPPFLFDDSRFVLGSDLPAPTLNLRHWSVGGAQSLYMRVDRPYFERAMAACNKIAVIPGANQFDVTIYDCDRLSAR